jgi:sterol desaturase/sphingolipid hydroxylase (fatty acid hydroxylase superfamily)
MILWRSLRIVSSLLVVMAALGILETVVPFRSRGSWRRAHLAGNLSLSIVTLIFNVALGVGGALVSAALRENRIGLLSGPVVPGAVHLVTAILVLDLSTYLAHALMHRVPWLWRVHRVHHTDPLVDVTTAYRQHPVETLIRMVSLVVPAWILGLTPESIALYRLVSALNALLEHANLRLWQPVDDVLALAVVTPNMHKVHHSRSHAETDSNYGNIFSIFDRAFKTFTPTARARTVDYGLAGFDEPSAQRFAYLMRLPLAPVPPATVTAAEIPEILRGR